MMRSLSSAVAGLRSHQTKMDVIGNNIANVNTYGFKSSRVTFADVYYQTLSSGSGAAGGMGGTNPTQIGYGASVATIDQMMSTAGAAQTDRALDVYITGDGFIVSRDNRGGLMYTRLGSLYFDPNGTLVDYLGNPIQGFNAEREIPASGVANDSNDLDDITIDPELLDKLTGITIAANGKIIGILEGDAKVTLSSGGAKFVDGDSVTIAPDSNITGAVRLQINAKYTQASFENALQSLSSSIMGSASGITLSELIQSEDYSFSDNITFTAGNANGTKTITATGTYINSNGNEVTYSATATVKGENPETLDFKFNNKSLFKVTGNFAEVDTGWPAIVNPTYGNSKAIDLTSTTNWSTLLASLGIDTTGATLAGVGNSAPGAHDMTTGTFSNVTIKTTATGVTIEGTYTDGADTYTFTTTAGGTNINNLGAITMTLNGTGGLNGDTFTVNLDTSKLLQYDNPYVDGAGDLQNSTATGTYEYLATWYDKGDNVRYSNDGEWTTLAGGTFNFGDITMRYNLADAGAFYGTIVTAGAEESEKIDLGAIVIAKFQNQEGLLQEGDSHWVASSNSGDVGYSLPGINGSGSLKGGYLEMSNVDISAQFTDMITTQRGFQANSRIITVSDEMLQELVNLKR